MPVLTFPSIRPPQSASLQLVGATQRHVSPFDGSAQTIGRPAQFWRASLTWGAIPHTEWRVMQAFISSLRGMSGRFTYTHPHTFRLATATIGTPLVKGAGQTGVTLLADGFTAGATVMKAGDFFSLADPPGRQRLYQVTADVVADGSGNATLEFGPPLRSSPPDNLALNLTTPSPLWMLASDEEGNIAWAARDVLRAGFTLNVVEALYGSADGLFTLNGSVLA